MNPESSGFDLYVLPLAVILVGAVLGTSMGLRTRAGTVNPTGGRREDLTEAHADAVVGLRALELEKHKLPADEYARQREALLAQGSEALRALEEEGLVSTPKPAADPNAAIRASLEAQRATLGDAAVDAALAALGAPGPTANAPAGPAASAGAGRVSPAWTGAAYALVAVALVFGLWWMIGRDVSARVDGAPMTGVQDFAGNESGPAGVMGGAQVSEPPQVSAWRERVTANADDLEAHNGLTEWAIGNQDLSGAMSHNSEAMRVDPADPDARTYRAYLLMSIGRADDALAILDEIRTERPDHVKSQVYFGLIAMSSGYPDRAIPALEAAIAASPDGADFLRERLEVARAMASGEAPPAPTMGLPADHPPTQAAPAQGGAPRLAPTAGGDVVASGQIRLNADAAARLTGREVVFVSVRDPAGGPPLASVRLPATRFPLDFEVRTSDAISMGGAPRTFPASFNLSVRVDSDGSASTKPETDPSGEVSGVANGATGVIVAL